MTSPATDLAKASRHAHSLCALGREDAAATVLRRVLAGLDPTIAAPDPRLVTAALTYLRCALASQELDDLALPWARYAAAASHTINGLDHPDTATAASTLIGVLITTDAAEHVSNGSGDDLLDAASLLVDARTALHGPDAPHTLTAYSFRAGVRHQIGHCAQGIAEATEAWMRCWPRYPHDGGSVLHPLTAMLWACGHYPQATNLLAMHVGLAGNRSDAATRFLQALLVPAHPLAHRGHHDVCAHHACTATPAARTPDPPCTGQHHPGPTTGARADGCCPCGQVHP